MGNQGPNVLEDNPFSLTFKHHWPQLIFKGLIRNKFRQSIVFFLKSFCLSAYQIEVLGWVIKNEAGLLYMQLSRYASNRLSQKELKRNSKGTF